MLEMPYNCRAQQCSVSGNELSHSRIPLQKQLGNPSCLLSREQGSIKLTDPLGVASCALVLFGLIIAIGSDSPKHAKELLK